MLVRQGLRSLLDRIDGIEVIGEAADAAEAHRIICKTEPDVALIDVRLPGRSGIDLLGDLQRSGCRVAAVLLTAFDDADTVLDGIRAGARGFLMKDISLEQLAEAVRTVAEGGSLIEPAVTEHVLRSLDGVRHDFESAGYADPLTVREREILRLLASGYSNAEIATALRIAVGTVKNHISSILSKMGVRDRTRAVLKALDCGYI